MAAAQSNLQRWVNRLGETDVPVLNNTVQQLANAAGDRETSARDLANIVLSDAAMTSGVLRAANSAYYTSASREISTITRAVVILGFDTVRAIGTSVAIIESFLTDQTRGPLLEVMRDSVCAAVQAKAIAAAAGDPQPEEVFVAALLSRLGEMAFWAFASDEQAAALQEALGRPGVTRLQAERETLGFSLNDLTRSLARAWNLGDLVQEAAGPPLRKRRARAVSVQIGHELQLTVRSEGWESPGVERLTNRVAEQTGLDGKQAAALLEDTREAMSSAARAFGVPLDAPPAEQDHGAADDTTAEGGPAPSERLQLRILRELSQVLKDRPDLQTVLDMVLEGIYRGVGMDRTLVAIVTRDRRRLTVRYTLGDSGRLREAFGFELEAPERGLFRRALDGGAPLWTARLDEAALRQLTNEVKGRFAADFFLAPLAVGQRAIGLIYADRAISARALDEEGFEAFCHFAEQANTALDRIIGGS